MTDFRIAADFFDHPKTVKLQATLGDTGIVCLLRLWAYATRYRTKGVLTNMTMADIAQVSRWPGSAKKYVGTLKRLRFLTKDEGDDSLKLHNWEERNPFVVGTDWRKERARKGGQAKRDKELASTLSTIKHPTKQALSSAPSPTPTPIPSPSPIPSPKKEKPIDRFNQFLKDKEGAVWEMIRAGKFDLIATPDKPQGWWAKREIDSMRAWLIADPRRGKSQWMRFITNWLIKGKKDIDSGYKKPYPEYKTKREEDDYYASKRRTEQTSSFPD